MRIAKQEALSVPSQLAVPQQVRMLIATATNALRQGRPGEAIAPLGEALRLQPASSIIAHDLGLACLEAGRIHDAIAALQRSTALNPRNADAHFRLGIAMESLGDTHGSLVAYDRATQLMPSLTEAWFRAGAVAYMLGHRDEAIGCFRRAAETGPRTAFGRLGRARALLTEDRHDEAERSLRQTLKLEPANGMAYDLLGHLLTEFGRFEEARACFERAISLAPRLAGSYYELVRCRPVTTEDDLMATMQEALNTPGLEAAQRLRLHLAIGKAADDLGDYTLAMRHFDAGSDVRRASLSFDADAFDREINRMMDRCTPEWLAQGKAPRSGDDVPVFIVGMPRSGTTLVEQIVSNHPAAEAGGELHFWNKRGAEWHRDGEDATLLTTAAREYLGLLRSIAPNAARVTDKMPFNFLWTGLIHRAFPRATILHCRRNVLDTALSIHQTHFHPGLVFPTGGQELVRYFASYQRLMKHWRNVLPAEQFFEVDYEQLTATPEPVIESILTACGLEWHDACLRPESNPRPVRTPSRWQARQPIYGHSVSRWRRYEACLGPLQALLET